MKTVFLRVLDAADKAAAILDAITTPGIVNRFEVDVSEFASVPGSPFSYWVGDELRRPFAKLPAFESNSRLARQGMATADDFRFVRTWWEVPANYRGWTPFAKGGAYSPIYADVYLLTKWGDDGHEIKAWAGSLYNNSHWSRILKNVDLFFRPGITWPLRTNGLSIRIMPNGCIFSHKGPAAFIDDDDQGKLFALVALANSKPFGMLVSLQLARTELAQSFEVGLIRQTPIPTLNDATAERLASLARQAWILRREADTRSETSHAFTLPALLQVEADRLASRSDIWVTRSIATEAALLANQASIDAIAFEVYGLADADLSSTELPTSSGPDGVTAPQDGDTDLDDEEAVLEGTLPSFVNSLVLAGELASWLLGVAFGRFDIRLATGARAVLGATDPFERLPLYSTGMLTGAIGLPAAAAPTGYPISPADSGIIVDDAGHEDDFLKHIQIILEELFGFEADRWLEELSAVLDPGNGDLRRWFAEQFFETHLKRYTKSKRKAPIYWQLAVPSGRYSLWLYAHRLTSDTFFRLQQDVVEPKLAHEERTLASLLQAGESASAGERLEAEVQQAFVAELREFAIEVTRVAPLWNPDLDDGVCLTMAPLWRLVPRHKAWQKELRTKWQELQAGKYDWSHIAMHLWPERVVPKCASDRSLAIAHGLEEDFWFEDTDGKWKPLISPPRPLEELVNERSSSAVKVALKSLLEAPDPIGASKRARKARVS